MMDHHTTPYASVPSLSNLCRRGGVVIRTLAPAVLGAAVMATGAHAQAAETNWWEGIQGFGVPDYGRPGERLDRRERKPDKVNDLRADRNPWRSDVMLEAMDIALERYQRIANDGGWPIVPPGRMMRPGDGDERLPQLRRRLRATGDLPSRRGESYSYESYEYDAALEEAVRAFQKRHGLRVSGRVDQPTLAALNVPVEARLNQLQINRDRLRSLLAQQVEDRYILVNVPAFQLEAVNRYDVELRHRVIVGRIDRQTPELKATIRALNFFPYWNVPESVARLDLIPRMVKEPDYLQKEAIRVFNGYNGPELDPLTIDWSTADGEKLKFKQDPGPQNALGLVRLDMANEHGVYMHDTPLKKLFDQRGRAFSAGCVRVQDVFQLVDWIAQFEEGWSPGRAADVVASGGALDVELTRPVPVHFAYITAWAESGGTVEFRPDIYGLDGSRELTAGFERDPDEAQMPAPTLAP